LRKNFGILLIGLILLGLVVVIIANSENRASNPAQHAEDTAGQGWSIAQHASHDPVITLTYVYVEPAAARRRAVYDDAVSAICPQRSPRSNICSVQFYLSGDAIPSRARITRQEGINPLATWWENDTSGLREYNTWDCDRAPVEDAPMRALCGQGVAEAYGAILSLALREGIGEACRWPVNKIGEPALSEILSAVSTDRAVYFRAAYDRMLETGRKPVDPSYDCRRYQSVSDKAVAEDMAKWRRAIGRHDAPLPAKAPPKQR